MELREASRSVPNQNVFIKWISQVYGRSALIGIRAYLDSNEDTFSLFALLTQMKKHSQLLPQAGEGTPLSNGVDQDLASLTDLRTKFKSGVDQFLAHRDRRPKDIGPALLTEIHRSIATLLELALKYDSTLNDAPATSRLPADRRAFHADLVQVWGEPSAESV